jgi:large subunit ribosomal protein L13
MKTIFPKENYHKPKWFLIDAKDLTLGRISTKISLLLRGKENSYYTPGVNQGNFVIVINASKINFTGNKKEQKLYYRNSQRPGSLKIESLKNLVQRNSSLVLERSVWGMLPKGILGRKFYKRLYVYPGNNIKIIQSKKERMKFIKFYLNS